MFNNIIKNNSVLENKKSKTLLYTIATLINLTFSSGSNEVYAGNMRKARLLDTPSPYVYLSQNVEKTKKTCNRFTPEEDEQLKNLVLKYGTKNWSTLAKKMPGRDRKQIRERYILYLDPNINEDPWTPEEDELAIKKQQELGNKWAMIARLLPGRTESSLRFRFKTIKRHLKKPELIQQSDQIATTLPVQEINLDKDVEEISSPQEEKTLNDYFISYDKYKGISLLINE